MDTEEEYTWKISTTGPPWIVIDWRNNQKSFETRPEAMEFIDRDRKMFDAAARSAKADVVVQIQKAFDGSGLGEHEQTAGTKGETSKSAEDVGGVGNRRSRRRARGSANSKKASGRGR